MVVAIIFISIIFLLCGTIAIYLKNKRDKKINRIFKPYECLFNNRKYESFKNVKKEILKNEN